MVYICSTCAVLFTLDSSDLICPSCGATAIIPVQHQSHVNFISATVDVSALFKPKNNDGQHFCLWCGISTKHVDNGFSNSKGYDICTKCKK